MSVRRKKTRRRRSHRNSKFKPTSRCLKRATYKKSKNKRKKYRSSTSEILKLVKDDSVITKISHYLRQEKTLPTTYDTSVQTVKALKAEDNIQLKISALTNLLNNLNDFQKSDFLDFYDLLVHAKNDIERILNELNSSSSLQETTKVEDDDPWAWMDASIWASKM